MGVYIKGTEMPTSCDMCWALDDYGDYPRCRITEEQRGYNFPIREKRMDNCPLVPVPPHGDLIDRDAIMDDIIGSMVFSGRKVPTEAADAIEELQPITNYDILISKSPEELAEMLGTNQYNGGCPNGGAISCQESCVKCWLDWLKQEADE